MSQVIFLFPEFLSAIVLGKAERIFLKSRFA